MSNNTRRPTFCHDRISQTSDAQGLSQTVSKGHYPNVLGQRTLLQKKERKPKASVLMPVYNTVLFLEEAVESILTQSFEDYEFVIVDDGSNDGSEKILAAFARKDARVRIIRNDKNMGIVYSLNRGLRECCGKYIVRMDSDDVALPNRLSKQIELMEAHPNITVLSASVSYIDASGRETGVIRRSQVTKSLLRKNGIIHPTVVIRRHCLLEHGFCYMERYRYAEDYFLWLQLGKIGHLQTIDDVVLKYRLNKSAIHVRHLKGVLWSTLKVKISGVFTLGMRPSAYDVVRFISECILLLMPSFLVLWIFMRMMFRKDMKTQL